MTVQTNKRNIFPVRNRSDIPRLVRSFSGLGQDCPFEFEGSYPEESTEETTWWMKIEESPRGKHIFDLKFYTHEQLISLFDHLTPHPSQIAIVFDSPAIGEYEHLHKNLWLVHSLEGLYAAARKVGRIPTESRIKLDMKLHITVDSSKFPALVALESGRNRDTVEIVSIITDTTLRFALEKMAGTSAP